MQLWWKILGYIFLGNNPEAPLELKAKIQAKNDSVQHLNRCLELEQPIIIHTLSKIKEDSD
jgi:hypothetical protein